MKEKIDAPYVVIFDGVCNLCNGAVQFIIRRDFGSKFVFSPMQSERAQSLIKHYHLGHSTLDTFLLIKNDQCFTRSDAALELVKDLSGYWPLLKVLRFIPRPIRDALYRSVAKHRYRLFGQRKTCMIPDKNQMNRFWL